MGEVLDFVATVIELSVNGFESLRSTFVPYNITDVGESHENPRTVFIAEATLYVQFLKQVRINLDAALHLVRKFVEKIVILFHVKSSVSLYRI